MKRAESIKLNKGKIVKLENVNTVYWTLLVIGVIAQYSEDSVNWWL